MHCAGSGMNMKRGVFSNRTVECVTNVEAFSLEAEDLVFLVNQFNHHLKNPRILGAIRYTVYPSSLYYFIFVLWS